MLPSLPVYHNTGKVHCMLCSALWGKFKKERLKGVEKTRIKGVRGDDTDLVFSYFSFSFVFLSFFCVCL